MNAAAPSAPAADTEKLEITPARSATELCQLGLGTMIDIRQSFRDRDEGGDTGHGAHPAVRGQATARPRADRGRTGHPRCRASRLGHRRAGLLHDDQPAAPRARQHPAVHLQQRPAQPVRRRDCCVRWATTKPCRSRGFQAGGRLRPGSAAVGVVASPRPSSTALTATQPAAAPGHIARCASARRRCRAVQRQHLSAQASANAPRPAAAAATQRGTAVARAPGGSRPATGAGTAPRARPRSWQTRSAGRRLCRAAAASAA